MGLSLWNLFKTGLLLMNALLILNRRRFLSKYGFDQSNSSSMNNNSYGGGTSDTAMLSTLKIQIIGLLQAVQYLRVPIIVCNTITIILEMLLGGT